LVFARADVASTVMKHAAFAAGGLLIHRVIPDAVGVCRIIVRGAL
jgi:hypothetical protein